MWGGRGLKTSGYSLLNSIALDSCLQPNTDVNQSKGREGISQENQWAQMVKKIKIFVSVLAILIPALISQSLADEYYEMAFLACSESNGQAIIMLNGIYNQPNVNPVLDNHIKDSGFTQASFKSLKNKITCRNSKNIPIRAELEWVNSRCQSFQDPVLSLWFNKKKILSRLHLKACPEEMSIRTITITEQEISICKNKEAFRDLQTPMRKAQLSCVVQENNHNLLPRDMQEYPKSGAAPSPPKYNLTYSHDDKLCAKFFRDPADITPPKEAQLSYSEVLLDYGFPIYSLLITDLDLDGIDEHLIEKRFYTTSPSYYKIKFQKSIEHYQKQFENINEIQDFINNPEQVSKLSLSDTIHPDAKYIGYSQFFSLNRTPYLLVSKASGYGYSKPKGYKIFKLSRQFPASKVCTFELN